MCQNAATQPYLKGSGEILNKKKATTVCSVYAGPRLIFGITGYVYTVNLCRGPYTLNSTQII